MHAAVYKCGRCGRSVPKTAHVCPHCGAQLADIKCRSCGFVGSETDFVSDRCPKCGTAQRVKPRLSARNVVDLIGGIVWIAPGAFLGAAVGENHVAIAGAVGGFFFGVILVMIARAIVKCLDRIIGGGIGRVVVGALVGALLFDFSLAILATVIEIAVTDTSTRTGIPIVYGAFGVFIGSINAASIKSSRETQKPQILRSEGRKDKLTGKARVPSPLAKAIVLSAFGFLFLIFSASLCYMTSVPVALEHPDEAGEVYFIGMIVSAILLPVSIFGLYTLRVYWKGEDPSSELKRHLPTVLITVALMVALLACNVYLSGIITVSYS